MRGQYKIDDNKHLSDLLLSPRARQINGTFMSCSTCYTNISRKSAIKPPRFGISNGWVIGTIPRDVIDGEVSDILSSVVARVRIFANVYSYSAGAHKAIQGHHVFFVNDPEHVGKSFDFMLRSGVQPDIYVMICGRVTPGQREIIRRRCSINANSYMSVLTWLIENHPSYGGMNLPLTCPQPIFIGGFDEEVNNTDRLPNVDPSTEHIIEGEEMSFAARKDPTEESGPFSSQRELILSYLKGQKPTLLLKNGDYLGGHKVNLVDLFPLIFPYGMGGPDEIRSTKVSPSSVLCHYPRIALP